MRYRVIDALRGTRTMPAYRHLISTRFSPDQLRLLQLKKLGSFLESIKAYNPLYAKLLTDVSVEEIRKTPVEVLHQLPVTDKGFVKSRLTEILSPVSGRRWQYKKSGGSTGEPFRYAIDLESVSNAWAYTLMCWNKYAGYRPGCPYITVAGSSLGRGVGGRRVSALIYRSLQNNYLIAGDEISGGLSISEKRIARMNHLFCYPSSLMTLLELNPDCFRAHRLKAVFTTSEQLLPNVRMFIEAQLGVPVFDMYGAYDGGIVSFECERHDGYHYHPLNCFVETFENGNGQQELLLTSITSISMPFVRYRVGDVAELGEFGSCPCGEPFPLIRNLLGRTRDMIKLCNGNTVHGSAFNRIFYEFPEVRCYRVIQQEDFHITVCIAVDSFTEWKSSESGRRLQSELARLLQDTTFELGALDVQAATNQKLKIIESHVS